MTPENPLILVRLEDRPAGRIAFVTVNRPEKLNALNSAVMAAFVAAFDGLREDTAVRAVVLSGAGDKAFIGGADVSELGGLDQGSARSFITCVHACCEAVRDFPAPVIARIGGYVLGAGLEIAASCDLRVASQTAVFGMPEVRLGIPSVVEAALLPQLVGWGRTREMLLLGANFSAEDAHRWGLVERLTTADGLDAAVEAWLTDLMACGAEAVRLQKGLIRRWEDLPLRAAIDAGIDAFEAAFETDEPRRMIDAFRAKPRG